MLGFAAYFCTTAKAILTNWGGHPAPNRDRVTTNTGRAYGWKGGYAF